MNIYEKSHKLSDGEFKRLSGVQRETFEGARQHRHQAKEKKIPPNRIK